MYKLPSGAVLLAVVVSVFCCGCRPSPRDPQTVVVLIESSPTSLDPRLGTDAQSEHIDELLFDGLVAREANYQFTPALAERWDHPDPLTFVFHLRSGVRFHDGRTLTARDVQWTINSMRDGTVPSPKANAYAAINQIVTPDPMTVILHLTHADNSLLENLSTGAIGIIPAGSGRDFWQHPVGTGTFRFVSQAIDQEIVLARNPDSWSTLPKISRVRFSIVPDANTRALEMQKGSADATVNALALDTLAVLARRPNLAVEETGGTVLQYLAFNTTDALLKDVRVRQAIAHAVDRPLIRKTLLGGHAQLAESLLPTNHWAWTDQFEPNRFDPMLANTLLDQSGHPHGSDGIRFHLTLKTSTDESARLLASVLQQQLARIGIALDLRSYEFATFYSDVVHGAFQLYTLRWVGGNEQPSIFAYSFATNSIPPKGANRGRYSNATVDALLHDAAENPDVARQRTEYNEVQKILAHEMPAMNLWYTNSIIVHNRRLHNVQPTPSGSFAFLKTAELVN